MTKNNICKKIHNTSKRHRLNSLMGAALLSILILSLSCADQASEAVETSTTNTDEGGSDIGTDSHLDSVSDADTQTDTGEDTVIDTGTEEEGAIITASGENVEDGETKEMAFDGDDTTKWLTFENAGWIQYDFAKETSKIVSGYSITSANDFPGRDPKDWSLKGSDDGISWTVLDERTNECFTDRLQTRVFRVNNETAYKMYRLDVSAIRDPAAGMLQIAEIELLEDGSAGIEPGAQGSCADSFKFVVVGDSRDGENGVNTEVWAHLVYAILAERAEFVLFTGDLTETGSQSELEQWIEIAQPLYDAGIGVYPVRGDHDSNLAAWNAAFSGPYLLPQSGPKEEKNLTYSKKYKNLLFVGIDNYCDPKKEVNQRWLDTQLEKNTLPHVFVFGHEPAFAASASDTLDEHPHDRDVFWQSLEAAGARTYFSSHDCFYDHARIDDGDGDGADDIHQFIAGTAGAPLCEFGGNYTGKNGGYIPIQQHHSEHYGYILAQIDGLAAQLTFKERDNNSYWATGTFTYFAE